MPKQHKHTPASRRRALPAKANPVYQGMTVIDGMTQPRSMPRNYKSYAREGYGGNDTLYKVVNYAITNGAAIPPVLYTDDTMTKQIDKHPLLEKLKRPNNEWTGVFYRKAIIGYFLISGNAFQYAIRTNKSGPPDELWILPPDRVRPIPDEQRGIIGYEYTDWPAEKNPIPPEFIGHMRSWNPEDPFFGMSPVQVAAIMIDQQTDARKWNLSLFQNFLKPPGAWTTDSFLSVNDRRKLEERINEKMGGYRNAGKTPVLDGSLKFQSSAVAPSEMDWIGSMKFNAGSIANIYNMPPQLIGDTSSTTYDNYEQAEIVSYTEFIFPTLDDLYGLWNMWLVPMYPDLASSGAYLYYDKTTVEVIQKVIQAQKSAEADRGNKLWLSGLAMQNEARAMAGLPETPDGDVYRFGAVLVRKGKLGDYADQSLTTPAAPPPAMPEPLDVAQPQPGQPPLQGNEGERKPANNNEKQPSEDEQQQEEDEKPPKKYRTMLQTKALDLSTKEEKAAYATSIEIARVRWETEYEKKLASYFDQERKAVVKSISSSSSTGALAGRAEGAINDQSTALKRVLLALYEDVCTDIGGQVAASLEGKKGVVRDFLSLFGDSQLKYLLLLAGTKIKQIATTTLAKVRLELSDGVAQGEGIPELAKRIDSLYLDQIIPNRSTTIARTEVVSSSNYAAVESAKESGLTLNKVWLATEDARTRPAHADADGQEVGMDEQFEVDGEMLDYPGDSAGSPENVVNCRCTTYFKRVQAQETDDDDDTTNEKRRKRLEYKQFMEKALA